MEKEQRVERFAALYRTARPPLLAYALRRTASPEDAADVIAETFTIAWEHLNDVPAGEASILWLYATARRVIANHGRRVQRRVRLVERIGSNLAVGIASQPDPSEQDSMESTIALARLSDGDREILMLAGWEGLDSAQLAYTLGCSPAAARVRLHHARARLKVELTDLGIWAKHGRRRQTVAVRTAAPKDLAKEAEAR
jgi:RNA polymerase sigma factor (sigma-70 family)